MLEEPEKKHRRRHTILLIVWIFAIIINMLAFAINITKCCIKLKEKETQVQCLNHSERSDLYIYWNLCWVSINLELCNKQEV